MIENVHSHEGEEQETNQAAYLFKPPKNIKQIGESTSQKKIYVEDYVFTYIKELVKKEYEDCRIAVLLGRYIKTKEERIILIHGAVEAEGIQYDTDSVFNNDTWTNIYEKIKRYFNDVEVVGWCIGGPGFILENEEKLKKIHLDNFAGVDKALLKYDSLEQEEAFYIYEHGTLNRQGGYYIYYDKNEDMQNYMIEHKENDTRTPKAREEEAVKEYEGELKVQKSRENDKSILHLMYAAGSLMVVIVIVVFAAMINNNNKINSLEQAVSELSATMIAKETGKQEETQVANSLSPTAEGALEVETISGSLNSIKTGEVIGDKAAKINGTEEENASPKEIENEPNQKDMDTEEEEKNGESQSAHTEEEPDDQELNTDKESDAKKPEETSKPQEQPKKDEAQDNTLAKETSGSVSEIKYYEVQKGDTLVGISFKLYQSGDYVSKIMELNQIEDMDMIYYGQKLIVP